MDPQKQPPADSDKPTENNVIGNVSTPDAVAKTDTPAVTVTPSGPQPPVAADMPANPSGATAWPTASNTSPSMPASSVNTSKPKKKGLLIGLAIALLILVLAGGAAAAYFSVIVPNKPENVLKMALANQFDADKIKSQHMKGEMSVTDKASKQTFTGDFTAAANNDGALDFKANVDVAVTKATLEMRSVDGKDFYVKVGGLEGLPELLGATGDETTAAYASVIAGVNDQWIEITQSMISSLTGESSSLKLSDADKAKLKQAYLDHEFLTIKEKLKDENISGKSSYHYNVSVDKQQLKDFIKAVKDAKLASIKFTQDDLDSFNEGIKNVDFSKYPVEMWISKDQKFIDQIKFTYDDKDVTASVTTTITEFNTPVNVTKPSGAKSLMQIISGLFGGSTGSDDETQLLEELSGSGISL
jgi:hypothetical protein